MRYRRTPALIDSDDFVLVVALAGRRMMNQFGREVVTRPGEAALVACAEPGVAVPHGFERWMCFRIPRCSLR
jgi:hypothetical protein